MQSTADSAERRREPRGASLRPLRRPVRPRDADARAGRARAAWTTPARPGFQAGARAPPARLRRAPDAAVQSPRPQRGRGRARSTSSARTCCTPGRTSSTTRSGRRCWPGAWASADHRRDRGGPARRRQGHGLCAAGPRVHRVHGRGGHPPPAAQRRTGWSCWAPRSAVEAGARTLKEAISEAIRDWVTNVGDDPLHDRLGRRPGAVPGDGARPATADRRRGPRAAPRARRAPARPRHRLRRRRLQRDRHVHGLHRRRRRRTRRRRGRRGRGWTRAATARR